MSVRPIAMFDFKPGRALLEEASFPDGYTLQLYEPARRSSLLTLLTPLTKPSASLRKKSISSPTRATFSREAGQGSPTLTSSCKR